MTLRPKADPYNPPVLDGTVDYTWNAALPSSVTKEAAVSLLHNHDFIIRCDKNLSKYDDVTATSTQKPGPVSKDLNPVGATKCYKIIDVVQNVPGGIWDSNSETLGEYTDLESGLFVNSKSPLAIRIETRFGVQEGGSDGGLQLACRSEVFASKVLLPVIKGSCKENLDGLFAKIVEKLGGA